MDDLGERIEQLQERWIALRERERDERNVGELRLPKGVPGGGEWTTGGAVLDKLKESTEDVADVAAHEDYRPGDWVPETREQSISRLTAVLTEELGPKVVASLEAKDPEGVRGMARDLVDRKTGQFHLNGPHTVWFADGATTPGQRKQLLSDVDKLQARFPVKGVLNISIEPSTEFGNGVGGETMLGSGSIRINAKLFKEATGGKHWHGGMPAADNVTSARYVLAHEWGHAIDSEPWPQGLSYDAKKARFVEMSHYGEIGGPHEGFAEAFAEWALTKGTTTNVAAQAYADQFGWAERWPT